MSKHTPGPWIADAWVGTDPYEDPDGPFVEVGDVLWSPNKVDVPAAIEQKANAHLIAAAPELFEALDSAYHKISDELERLYHNAFPSCCGKVTISECCGDFEQTWTAEDSQAMDFLAPIHEEMRAALAKAKGEEHE